MPDVNFEHKPFTDLIYCARWNNNGDLVEAHGEYTLTYTGQDFIDSIGEDEETCGAMLYEARIEWIPVTRIESLEDGGAEPIPLGDKQPQSKIQRLQTAVRELLESLNAAEFEIYHQDPYGGGFKPRTIETFGLKKEDME